MIAVGLILLIVAVPACFVLFAYEAMAGFYACWAVAFVGAMMIASTTWGCQP